MAPETEKKLEHARWLLDRSDHLRSSYANRAALVLGIDAGILGALFAVLGLTNPPFMSSTGVLLAAALLLTSASVVYAFLASSNLRTRRRRIFEVDSDKRQFLNPTNTFGDEEPDFKTFKSRFDASSQDAFVEHVLSELYVALPLQDRRYFCLKRSVHALFGAMGAVVALLFTLLIS
jgi:hypothetical protein